MEKVFVLCRMWDKTPRGHETVERISTDIEPILEYIKKFSYVGGEKTQKIEMDESFNMGKFKKTGEESIKYYFNSFRKSICQYFIKVTGNKFDDPENKEEYTMYRLQIRNIH